MAKDDNRDEQLKSLSDQLAASQQANDSLTLERDALARERDSLRDQLALARQIITPVSTGKIERPADLDDYKGEYKNLRDGQIYGLKVLPETDEAGNKIVYRSGKTHVAKCHTHTWDGTEEEFRLQFQKQ